MLVGGIATDKISTIIPRQKALTRHGAAVGDGSRIEARHFPGACPAAATHCGLRGNRPRARRHAPDTALGGGFLPIAPASALAVAGRRRRSGDAPACQVSRPRGRRVTGERVAGLGGGVADGAPRLALPGTPRGISPRAGGAAAVRPGVHRLEGGHPLVQPVFLGPGIRRLGRGASRRRSPLGDPPADPRQAPDHPPARLRLPDVASGTGRRGGLAGLESRSGRAAAVSPWRSSSPGFSSAPGWPRSFPPPGRATTPR